MLICQRSWSLNAQIRDKYLLSFGVSPMDAYMSVFMVNMVSDYGPVVSVHGQ